MFICLWEEPVEKEKPMPQEKGECQNIFESKRRCNLVYNYNELVGLILEHYSSSTVTKKLKETVTIMGIHRNSPNYSIILSKMESKDIK
jgi:hypothetical protein